MKEIKFRQGISFILLVSGILAVVFGPKDEGGSSLLENMFWYGFYYGGIVAHLTIIIDWDKYYFHVISVFSYLFLMGITLSKINFNNISEPPKLYLPILVLTIGWPIMFFIDRI